MKANKGFTLIELLVVIGIIAILASVVIVALNPARQFAQARNTQRSANITAILNAVGQNMADNRGVFLCTGAGAIPTTTTRMASSTYNILPCIVPTYVSIMPIDPDPTYGVYVSDADYNSGYDIARDAAGRITISAPGTELTTTTIAVTR